MPPKPVKHTDHVDAADLSERRARVRMMSALQAVFERRFQIPYSQNRPSQLLNHELPVKVAAKLIRQADCSGLAGLGLDWGNVRPGGKKVDYRYVNTWILLALFPHETTVAHAVHGDLVFYGPHAGDPHHVAIYKGGGKVVTNGHYPMSVEEVDYRSDRIAFRSIL